MALRVDQTANARIEKRERRQAAKQARLTRRNRVQQYVLRGVGILLVAGIEAGLGWWILRPQPGTFVPRFIQAHRGTDHHVQRGL